MSKQTDLLDLEKCIFSRLWYTSMVLWQTEIEQECTTHRNVENLKNLIGSCGAQGLQEQRWIAYKFLSQVENNREARESLVDEEFNCAVKLLDTRIPNNVKEELEKLFEAVGAARQNKTAVPTKQLSEESLQCLEANLLEDPALVHWIINSLLCIWLPASFAQTDSALQHVYFSSLNKLLAPPWRDGLDDRNSATFQMSSNRGKERLGVLLSILSKLDLTDAKEEELVSWLFPALLESCKPDDVQLALYSRKNYKFFKAWHEFLDETYARCVPADSLENAIKVCRVVFDQDHFNANEIFKRILRSRSHWLTDIFDICYVLLINERYNQVERILGSAVLKDLWLPVLLKLLKECPSVQVFSPAIETSPKSASVYAALRFVLEKIAPSTWKHVGSLKRVKKTLDNHLDVLDWILRSKENSPLANATISNNTNYPHLTIKQAFHLLQNHSILAVVKMTTDIHEKDYEEINALLKDDEKNTFKAYRAMLSALKGILMCDFYETKYRQVAENFDDMEKLLGSLFPLDQRLEVIENIFSMLFLRYEDFVEADGGGGGEHCTEKWQDAVPSETGFVCNKYATRETLHRVKRSVTAAEAECADHERHEPLHVTNGVKKSLAFISKAVADATWRLELLTSTGFIERQGTPDGDSAAAADNFHLDERLNYWSNSKKKTIFYKSSESSSDESELMKSDLNASSEAGSQGNSTGRRRKRSRIHSNVTEPSTPANQREQTLNCMLASKESLVLQCLWKSDYDRASQVIEMFNLNKSRLDGEILFSRAMRVFRKDLRTQWANSDSVDSPDVASKHSTLENIRRAVLGGFQTSRTTSQVETFLAAQESSVRILTTDGTTAKELLTMAALDLALTMSHTRQDSVNLSDVTIKYLESCKKLSQTRYYDFFDTIYKLLYEKKPESSVREILCDARLPLSVKQANEKNDYWSLLSEKLETFRQMERQKFSQHNLDDESINEAMHPSERNFQEIMSICENGELYLPRVDAHLKLLRTIFPQEASEADFCLLKTSLDAYIGHQIFSLNLELDEVESIATKLGVNLVHSILVNCCPKLVCKNNKSEETTTTTSSSDKWGSIVFNKIVTNQPEEKSQEPIECVTEILRELLAALGKAAPHEQVAKILTKTQRLATLDLSNLSFGNQTLAFFVNLWNLLMLHTILEIWAKDPPVDDLRHEIALSAVRYVVGDLGTVSLAALRSKLLGQASWGARQYFSHAEELNEPAWQDLDVPNDPRVIFALVNEYRDTPIIRVYTSKTLDEELNAAARDYLDYYEKRCGSDNETTTLPELVERYNSLVAKNANNKDVSNTETENSGKVCCYTPLDYSYDIKFAYGEEKSSNLVEVCKAADTVEFCWQRRIVKPSLLQYLQGHCWLLSYLVERIHESSPTTTTTTIIEPSNSLGRTAALENLVKSAWANSLKSLYQDNQFVAGLRKISMTRRLWNYMESLVSNGETSQCLRVINALPDSLLSRNVELQRLRDKILAHLATTEDTVAETLEYIYQIRDEQIVAQLILGNNDLPVGVCQEALRHLLSHANKAKLPVHCKSRMKEILCRVTVFHKMLPYCGAEDKSWHETTNPVRIVRCLMDANQYELCLEWLEYQTIPLEIHSQITQHLLIGLLDNEDDFKHASKLLGALAVNKSVNLCKGVIGKLEAIGPLRLILGYLVENATSTAESDKYRKCLLGVDILEQLETKERTCYAHLIQQPLLMLEQLLMNCRLDSLQRILVAIGEKRATVIVGYTQQLDKIVRFYAKKSLDFRVAAMQGADGAVKDSSVSSNKSQSGDFVMPPDIPTKDEWVPNDKARECSCCRVVIFSMFNRRHHCRRCGRVVCATCSPQRMRLPSYPNSVPVRVCNDCKRLTQQQQQQQLQAAVASTPSSEAFDCWRLGLDETHNKTLREEFSFENAPNISLCLAILNLHSDNEAYSNFLLDRCDEMKHLLRPDSKGRVNPEVDHGLIIKMIRSLLVAAKVKCAELGLNTGLTHCDRFLSQVDLITTLVNSDCSSLIPRIDKDDHLDDHTLRRLRDLLTEKEEWILALDVSTKTGLDTHGVWAAWGTACLKVGYYERAREKFLHCLDRVLRDDSEDWVMLSYPHDENRDKRSTKQEGLKNRPSKDPPLLTEILQILEKTNWNDSHVKSRAENTGGPQEILNSLGSLKAISQGQYSIAQSTTTVNNNNGNYQESLYYLVMYGSFNSILEFFVRHADYDKCLSYIIENDVEPELFINSVFMPCLRNGCIVNLLEAMKARDATLVALKKYLIYTCHSLERKELLHTLHQLQLFMKDYVRAAMTCIRFYVADATSYENLCSKSHLLVEAQKHLESELQLENFGSKRRKSVVGSSRENSLTLEMDPAEIDRHMNTISRQMEIAKFLGNREQEGKSVSEFMSKLSAMETSETSSSLAVPTLFGNQQEKTHLAVLAILCGRDVEEGFGIAFRIMQDYNLRQQKIYSLVGHMLALERKINSIEQLIKCCRSSGAPNSNAISDRVLAHCVKLLLDRSRLDSNPSPKDEIDALIRIITDVELKIESYIESRQLKAAYLLAVKHSRAQDIRKILKEADRLGQQAIKSICTKWLQQTRRS